MQGQITTSRCAVLATEPNAPISIQTFSLTSPSEDSILVGVDFAGICGTDPHLWRGDFPLPGSIILGHEGIGTVLALHPSVTTDHASSPLAIGDRVYWTGIRPCGKCYYCTVVDDECGCPDNFFMHKYEDAEKAGGTWATYTDVATLGPRNAFFKVDRNVDPRAFIALGCALPTMLQALRRLPGGIAADENVVVQGAGALGLAAIMMAKRAGAAKVVLLEANDLRMEKARDFGADICINIKMEDREKRRERIVEAVGHRGVGLVIECSGVADAVEEGLDLLARNGKYLLVGTWAGKGTVRFDPFLAVNKAITMQGSTYCAPKDYYDAARLVEKEHERFPLASCVTHRFSLDQTQQGLETVLQGKAVKAVVEPGKA